VPTRDDRTDAERSLAALLTAVPEALTFSDEDPSVVVDRYYAPDFEQYHDGVRLDRDRLAQHAGPARKNVLGLHTEVHDILVRDSRFAVRYTLRTEMRQGTTLMNEVFMHGHLAPDGRIDHIDSTSRTVPV
jgi:hypothetical protein